MADFAATQPLYVGLDERERGPADELPALAAAALLTAAALCDTEHGAVVHMLQVSRGGGRWTRVEVEAEVDRGGVGVEMEVVRGASAPLLPLHAFRSSQCMHSYPLPIPFII